MYVVRVEYKRTLVRVVEGNMVHEYIVDVLAGMGTYDRPFVFGSLEQGLDKQPQFRVGPSVVRNNA